jgi:hypothetical protein
VGAPVDDAWGGWMREMSRRCLKAGSALRQAESSFNHTILGQSHSPARPSPRCSPFQSSFAARAKRYIQCPDQYSENTSRSQMPIHSPTHCATTAGSHSGSRLVGKNSTSQPSESMAAAPEGSPPASAGCAAAHTSAAAEAGKKRRARATREKRAPWRACVSMPPAWLGGGRRLFGCEISSHLDRQRAPDITSASTETPHPSTPHPPLISGSPSSAHCARSASYSGRHGSSSAAASRLSRR